MVVDIAMTAILLLLMGYSRIGEAAHEVLGASMFVLLVAHHVLNRAWTARVPRGRYTPYRAVQTFLVFALLVTVVGSAVSGVVVSKHLLESFEFGGTSVARTVHMLCGHWNFVLMSAHLGFHWVLGLGAVRKRMPCRSSVSTWLVRVLGAVLAAYGVLAMLKWRLPDYLFGIVKFASFDPSVHVVAFLADYAAMMAAFAFVAHYCSLLLRKASRGNA